MIDRIAIVTGASRGLGRALAAFLAAQGWRLVLTARTPSDLDDAVAAMRTTRHVPVALAGDVTDPGHRRALARAAGDLGGADLLVNNASDLGESPLPRLASASLSRARAVFEANVVAPLALVQEALPQLARRRGLVVNVSSDAALGGYPGWGVYGASKAALDLLTRTLAAESGDAGVAFVSVDPGDMRTRMHQDAYPGEDIGDRPEPEVTLPFWAWLLAQEPAAVSGRRFRAQDAVWEVPA